MKPHIAEEPIPEEGDDYFDRGRWEDELDWAPKASSEEE